MMFVVKYTDVPNDQFVGSTRPVATKKAARRFASVQEADRVMAIMAANFGQRGYKVLVVK